MPDRTTPEELLNQWLDALNDGDAPPAPEPIEDLASVALEYRRVLGTAPGGSTVQPERNGKMYHSQTLARPNGTSWRIATQPKRERAGWSSWLATALMIALLAGLVGGTWVQQYGLPGGDDPSNLAGIAASPEATPAGGSLACAAPGHRAVVEGDVDAATDVDLGGSPIERAASWTVVPTGNGSRTLPASSYPIEAVPGAYVSWNPGLGATVISTVLNESWEFPALDIEADLPIARSILTAGPYVIGAIDPSGVDYRILDVRSGDEVLVSNLIGGSFPWAVVVNQTYSSDPDSDHQAVQFVRAREFQDRSVPETTVTGDDLVSPEALHDHDTVAVVLPGTVRDAVAIDVSDISGSYGSVGPSEVVFDIDQGHIAWRGWLGTGTDEERFGFFVAAQETLTDPMTYMPVDTPAISLPITFSPDGTRLYVLEDNTIEAIAIADGTASQVATGRSGSVQVLSILAINRDADTVLYSFSGRETWLLDTASGETSRVPALDGYIIDPYGTSGFAIGTRFDLGTPGEGSTRTWAVVNTATGQIVTTNTQRTVETAGAWSYEQIATSDRYVAELDTENETLGLTDLSTGESWTMDLPRVIDEPTGPDAVDPAEVHTSLSISPNESCLVLNVKRDNAVEGNKVQGAITTEHVGTWIAPIHPNAEWTELPFELLGWWAVPTDDRRILPAQEFATPVATPVSTTLPCDAPGYRAVVSGEVDPDALSLIGGEPIDISSNTITAANGTEIAFEPDEQWAPYPSLGTSIILSGTDLQEPDTVTSLATGDSWSWPEHTQDATGADSDFTMVGPWMILPTDDTSTDWRVINVVTGDERFTSDLFGSSFPTPHHVSVPGPWAYGDSIAAIVGFPSADGGDGSALVLPSSDLDDAWALDPGDLAAAMTGVITSDGSRVAYVDPIGGDRVVVLDGFTGEQLGYYHAPETDGMLQTVGLTAEDGKMILRDSQRVWTVDLAAGEIATVFDPEGVIHSFAFDATTSTALASSGDGPEESYVWIDPATGAVKELDIATPMRFPRPQFGWAVIQTRDDFAVDYALLNMTTGELVTEPLGVGRDENGTSIWITGGDDTGVFLVRGAPGTLLVLDGPGGRAFEVATPEQDSGDWNGVALGVSPNAECLVYSHVGEGDAPGTSWIAPLAPDAEWTKLPFELAGWVEMPEPASLRTTPAPASATPAASAVPAITSLLPVGVVPIVEVDDPDAVDQTVFGTIRDTGPAPQPGITLPRPNGKVLELPDAVNVTQLPGTTLLLVERFDTSRVTIDLATGETVTDTLPPATEDERWIGTYIFTPGPDGTIWRITDVRTGERIDTAAIGGEPFPHTVTPVPVGFGSGDLSYQLVRFGPPDADRSAPLGATPAVGSPGGTLVLPGSLADARFLEHNAVPPAGLASTTAFAHPEDSTSLLAFVTDARNEIVRVENAITGETVAVFSASEIGGDGPVYIAGFDDNATTLTVWSKATVSQLHVDGSGDVTRHVVDDGWVDLAWLGDGTLLASVNPFYDAPEGAADWRLLDLDTGDWRPLPALDGFRFDRMIPGSGIIVLSERHGLATTAIAMVDTTSGEPLARLEDADVGAETARTISHDGRVYVITGHTGDDQSTGYVVDATSGASWQIDPPAEGQVWYGVSPDGSRLTASTSAGDGWVAPVVPDAGWLALPAGRIVEWLRLPDGGDGFRISPYGSVVRSSPCRSEATSSRSPAISARSAAASSCWASLGGLAPIR